MRWPWIGCVLTVWILVLCLQVTDPDERQKLYDEYIVRLKEKRAGKRIADMSPYSLLFSAAVCCRCSCKQPRI